MIGGMHPATDRVCRSRLACLLYLICWMSLCCLERSHTFVSLSVSPVCLLRFAGPPCLFCPRYQCFRERRHLFVSLIVSRCRLRVSDRRLLLRRLRMSDRRQSWLSVLSPLIQCSLVPGAGCAHRSGMTRTVSCA